MVSFSLAGKKGLKESSSKDMIQKLASQNQSFELKNEYSKEKYIKRKETKSVSCLL
jgi:hypothetical protein